MKQILVALLLVVLLDDSTAIACGFCGGDKAASVYSFKNKGFAKKVGANYVSAELAGAGGAREFQAAVGALVGLDGVYPKTVQSAYAQKAVSFVFKADTKFEDVAEALARARPGWTLKLVEQID